MIDALKIYDALKETLDDAAAKKLAEVLSTIYDDLQNAVTKSDFRALQETVQQLVTAQKETQEQLLLLTDAQTRTEKRLDRFEAQTAKRFAELAEAQLQTGKRLEELAQAQTRTEKRLDRFEAQTAKRFAELAEAQARTEQRLEELTKAQAQTDKRLEQLAEAQARTEQRLVELAQAQTRTEQRLDRFEAQTAKRFGELTEAQARTEQRLEELAQAQTRTEKRLDRFEAQTAKRFAELTEAQARTEQRLEELAKAQTHTEKRLAKLTEAQTETEDTLKKLIIHVENVEKRAIENSRQLGGLAMTVGYSLEDRAYKALPELLKRDHNLILEERLTRKYVVDNKARHLEVNILGQARRNGQLVTIVGEAKAQLSKREVDRFIRRKLHRLKGVYDPIFPVLVTYMITEPAVEDYCKEKGIQLYYSYDF